MKSIQYKLLIVILPVLVIALTSVAFINHNKAKEFLEEEFHERALESIEKAESDIDNYFLQKIKEAEVIANTRLLQTLNLEEIIPYIKDELNRLEGFEMFLVSDLEGKATSHLGEVADVHDREYFVEVLATENTVISQPIISRATGNTVVAMAIPIKQNESLAGVLIATIEIDDIVQLISNYKIGNQGYAFLYDESGVVIAHPNEQLIMNSNLLETENKKLHEMVTNSLNGEKGAITYQDEKIESFGFYTSIPTTNWGLVISAPVKEVTSNLSYLAMLSFVTAGVVLGFSTICVIVFSRRLVEPIKKLSYLTSKVAAGDLTVRSDTKTNDEVGVLSTNFDAMVKKILQILKKIDDVSSSVKTSSDTLLITSKETKEASEQVAVTISELAMGTTDIADSVSSASERMNTMLGTVQQISQYTNEVVLTSAQSKESAEKGLIAAEEAQSKMEDVNNKVNETVTLIHQLDHQAKEIENIIEIITNIAEQTNLLALNASIEAARAGEHGKGFAIVADEVRKLANETSESAEQIAAIIKETQDGSQKAVHSIEEGVQVVKEGTTIVQKAGESFNEIARFVDDVLERNKLIARSVQELEEFGSEIGSSMESISAVTEQASAGSEEVSATTQQQAAAANQIASDAEHLAELANELREVMSVFKTK